MHIHYYQGGNGQLREYFRKHKIDHLPLIQVYIRNETDLYRLQLRDRVNRILSGEIPSEPYRKNIVTEVYTEVYNNSCNNSSSMSPCNYNNNSTNNTISNSNSNSAKDTHYNNINSNNTTSQPSISKIKVIFLTGSLGLTLSQNGFGNAVISKLEVGGQAQLSGCHIGDYVISVNEVDVYDYIEVIRAIKESPRPLKVAFKRYNILSIHTLLHPISPAHSPKANGGSSSDTPRQVLPIALKVVDRTSISTIHPHSLELSLTGYSSPRAASTSTRSSPRYLSSSSRSHYSDRPSSPRVLSERESARAICAHPNRHLSLDVAAVTPSYKDSASPASARVSTGRSAIPSGRSVKSIKSVQQPMAVEPALSVKEVTEDLAGLALISSIDAATSTSGAVALATTQTAVISNSNNQAGELTVTGALESPGRVAVGVINTINEVLGDDPSYHSPYRLQPVDRIPIVSHTTPTLPTPLHLAGTPNDIDESSRLLGESIDEGRVDDGGVGCGLLHDQYVSPTNQESPIADDGYDTYAYNLTDDTVDTDIDADLIIKPVELYPEEEEGKAAKAETKDEKDTGPGMIEAFGQEQGEGEELEGLLHTVEQYDDHSVSSDDSSGSEELPLYNTDEDFLHDDALGQNNDLIQPTNDTATIPRLSTLKVDISDASFEYLQSSSRSIIESDLEQIHHSQGQSHYMRLTQYDMLQQQLQGEGYPLGYCVCGDLDGGGGGAMQGHLNTSYLEVNICCIMYVL